MVYSTVRSKAVVPVLVLLFVALLFFLRGDLFISYLVLYCSCAFRKFVRFALVWFRLLPLPLGIWEGLRFVSKL